MAVVGTRYPSPGLPIDIPSLADTFILDAPSFVEVDVPFFVVVFDAFDVVFLNEGDVLANCD